MTSAFRLFATGLVALLCCLSGARAADRSAEYSAILARTNWQSVDKDIQRLTIAEPGGLVLSAFRLDPSVMQTRIVPALDPKGSTAADMLRGAADVAFNPMVAINGGYFDRAQDGTLTPTGLLIANSETLSPLTTCRACSGVLFVNNGTGLKITWAKSFKMTADVTSAVQAGPLLVEPGGKIGIATPGGPLAERSAICLSSSKEVTVVAVTSRVTLYELAALLQAPAPGGFGCDVAINLDGGPSTQVATWTGKTIGSSSPVQNFVVFGLSVSPF